MSLLAPAYGSFGVPSYPFPPSCFSTTIDCSLAPPNRSEPSVQERAIPVFAQRASGYSVSAFPASKPQSLIFADPTRMLNMSGDSSEIRRSMDVVDPQFHQKGYNKFQVPLCE